MRARQPSRAELTAVALTMIASFTLAACPATAQIAWQTNLRKAHGQAKDEGKMLLLHFYTDNCKYCDLLEDGAFASPDVQQAIHADFVPVKIHGGKQRKLAAMFKVDRFPTDVVVTTEREFVAKSVSPQKAEKYVAMLTKTLPAGRQRVPNQSQIAANASQPPAMPRREPPPPAYASAAPVGQPVAVSKSAVAPPRSNQFAMPPETHRVGIPAQTVSAPIASRPTETNTPPADEAPSVATVEGEDRDLAMEGFCPVTVIRDEKWVLGSRELGVIHLGKLYLFSTPEAKQTFLNDPMPYTPVLNGLDVVRFFEERKIVQGKREWGITVQDRMFLFADEAAMTHFFNTHDRYFDSAVGIMDEAVRDANPN